MLEITRNNWNLNALVETMVNVGRKKNDIQGYLLQQLRMRKHPAIQKAIFFELEKRRRMN